MTKKWVLPVVLAAVLLAVIIVLGANSTRTVAQDEPPQLEAGLDAGAWHLCTIRELAIFNSRMHVRCYNVAPDGVFYFAVPSDSTNALMSNRYLTLLNTAFALNQEVYIYYETTTSVNPPGCLAADCRKIYGLTMDK